MNRYVLFSIFFLTINVFSIVSQDKSSFTITNYGTIIVNTNNEKIEKNKDNVTDKLIIIKNDSNVFSKTEIVDAELNTYFGFEYKYLNTSNEAKKVIYRYYHPEIVNPITSISSIVDTIPCEINPGSNYIIGWKFNEEWELVKGEWIFQIIENNIIVLERKFLVR